MEGDAAERQHSSHPHLSSGPAPGPVGVESLRHLSGRESWRHLASRLLRGRLHLSITSSSQPNVPIIAETTPAANGSLRPSSGSSHSSQAHVSPLPATTAAIEALVPPDPASVGLYTPRRTSTDMTLTEAEAGVSRRLTSQEGDNDGSDLAADAERMRLTATPISSLDLRAVARSVETALPFMVMVLLVFLWHHLREIVVFGLGSSVLLRHNIGMQAQVARKGELSRTRAAGAAVGAALCAAALASAGLPGRLPAVLTFRASPANTQFWTVFFTAILADLFLRLCLAAAKAAVLAAARADTQARRRRRGAVLSFLDYSVAVQRALQPAPLWLKYFQASGLPWPLAMCLCGSYLIAKAAAVLEKVSLAGLALAQVRGAAYGTTPTAEELSAAPAECAICQDALRAPVRLVCGHIYCDGCIEEWLAREASCPMCRREVRRPTLQPRSDGATSLFPVLC